MYHIYINKRQKNPAQIRFHRKRPYSITKRNDINMDSAITGSMNARN